MKFEYKILKNISWSQITEANMDNYGDNGWELVVWKTNSDNTINMILKRVVS